MKRIATCALAAMLAACAAQRTTAPVATPVPAQPRGMTFEEEAAVLRLEDRREFDPVTAGAWMTSTNPVQRARMALALGRIGSSTFVDANSNGERDSGERMAGVDLLIAASTDPDTNVRRNVAFSLGETGDPAGIDTLFKLADDPEHADIGAEAVEALAKVAASVPLERYAEFTTLDVREGIRARAIRYLFRFGTDAASSIAAKYTDDVNTDIRREAVYALARRAYAPARQRLELLLSDTDILTRSYAARALGLIADPQSVNALFTGLSDIHPWVRINSARSIGQIAEKHPDTARSSEHAVRMVTLTRDPDPGTRVAATETLGYYTRASDIARNHLLELASAPSAWQREAAVAAIARHLGEGRDSPVHTLIATDSRWLKIRALEGSTLHRTSGPILRERLFADADPSVRATAISAIPEGAVEAELPLVRRALEDPDPMVRAAAVERYIGPAADVDVVRRLEERSRADSLNDARLAAITALVRLEWPDREAFLRSLLGDRDPVVRRIAAEAIEQQLKKPRPQYTPLPIDRPLSYYDAIAEWARSPHTATIHTARGNIELILLPHDAPITAKNFADLASRGYFNGTSFMRVVPNFVIQGGDPRNDMSGGPGYAIRDEINLQKYTRGAVGMALSGPDTGGSQFFITHSPQPHLDGGYTIFGRVVGGMSGVVDQIERGDTVERITIDSKPQ